MRIEYIIIFAKIEILKQKLIILYFIFKKKNSKKTI